MQRSLERAARGQHVFPCYLYRKLADEARSQTVCMEGKEPGQFTFSKHLSPPLDSPYNHDNHPAGWLPPPCLSPKGGLRGREAIAIVFSVAVITVAVARGTRTAVIKGLRRQISIILKAQCRVALRIPLGRSRSRGRFPVTRRSSRR